MERRRRIGEERLMYLKLADDTVLHAKSTRETKVKCFKDWTLKVKRDELKTTGQKPKTWSPRKERGRRYVWNVNLKRERSKKCQYAPWNEQWAKQRCRVEFSAYNSIQERWEEQNQKIERIFSTSWSFSLYSMEVNSWAITKKEEMKLFPLSSTRGCTTSIGIEDAWSLTLRSC